MSVTIAALKYQDTDSAIHRYMRDNFSWLYNMTVLDNVKGKSTINGIDITGSLLASADCTLNDIDTTLVAKETELDYYNLSFPISQCDLHQTWLSAFASKYRDESELYIENLVPYLAEKLGDEVRTKIFTDALAEAALDADVAKVTLTGTVATPSDAFGTIAEFISKLPTQLKDKLVDKYSYQYYSVSVSPEVYLLAAEHLGDKVDSYGVKVSGVRVLADKTLDGDSMYCSSDKNFLVTFDSAEDLSRIKIVEKEWINTSYIVTGLAFKGSYVDSSEIVISN